jgi:type I restriction enzyme S subunit
MREGWEIKKIEEITSKLGDGLHGTPKYCDNGEYYFINGNNLNNGQIIFKEKTKRVSLVEYEK